METVRSRDNTPIAYKRSGAGPALVLVHGTTADHTRWARISPTLEQHFTVYAMDRRGRGGSGDSDSFELEREFEDVTAVVEAAEGPVNLLGHSYGALCALEGALRSPRVERLVLYEPVFGLDEEGEMYAPGTREKLEGLLAAGEREQALLAFFRDVVEMSEQEIHAMRSDPSWEGRLAAAHTLVREMEDEDYAFDAARISALAVPTLLLVGERSPPIVRRPSDVLAATLQDARLVVMDGQAHAAITTAPDLFLREVMAFLTP